MLKIAMLALLSLAALPALAQVKIETQDVGEIYQTNIGHSTILFNNVGDKPVKILAVSPEFEKDTVGEFKLPVTVAPKTSVNIPVTVYEGMDVGDRRHTFTLETDLATTPKLRAQVRLFGLSVLDDPKPVLDLGTVNTNSVALEKTVKLTSREVPGFRVSRIIESPDFAIAKILPDAGTISIAVKADASWGTHEGVVKVALDSAVQPQAWIDVKADVHGDVIPSRNPVDLGIFRTKEPSFLVQLKSRDGNPVKLGKVSVEGIAAKVETGICAGEAKGCAQIHVKYSDDLQMGRVWGTLLVDLPDFHRQLPIKLFGYYMPEDLKIRSFDKANLEKKAASSTEPPPLDLKSALQKSTEVAPPPAADPPGHGPLLKWQVSNENNMYGYLIYRGDSENGPFLRVNKDIVHVGADKGDGITSSYAWRDDSATAGKTYWYYIGMLNRDGTKQQLSGPQEVKAK